MDVFKEGRQSFCHIIHSMGKLPNIPAIDLCCLKFYSIWVEIPILICSSVSENKRKENIFSSSFKKMYSDLLLHHLCHL